MSSESATETTSLLPTVATGELRERGDELAARSLKLQGALPAPVRQRLQALLRATSAQASDAIEGAGGDVVRRDRLAAAHAGAELALEQRVAKGEQPLSAAFAFAAHRELYQRLSAEDQRAEQGMPIEPGELRTGERAALASPSASPRLRFDEVYARRWLLCELPFVAACAHHRIAWVRPFAHGSARSARLQTHAALWPLTQGLWSVNRGLAQRRDAYRHWLSAAGMAAQGDLDERGNLSERALLQWCRFFLDACAQQVDFMAGLLDREAMRLRIAQFVAARGREPGRGTIYRPEIELPLFHLFAAGPVSRGEFQQLSGLPQRTAVRVLQGLLQDGTVTSASRHAPVHLAFSEPARRLLLPGLDP